MSIFVFGIMNLAQVLYYSSYQLFPSDNFDIHQALPYLDKPFNVTKVAFDAIFGSAKIMYLASISAYLVGQLADIWLFGVIKRLTKGKVLTVNKFRK